MQTRMLQLKPTLNASKTFPFSVPADWDHRWPVSHCNYVEVGAAPLVTIGDFLVTDGRTDNDFLVVVLYCIAQSTESPFLLNKRQTYSDPNTIV